MSRSGTMRGVEVLRVLLLLALLLLAWTRPASAEPENALEPPDETPAEAPLEAPEVQADELLDIDLLGDELLLFEDIPTVVSASRRPQRPEWASAPLTVITAEDIHFSGLTTIAEVLLRAPGIDWIPLDRREYAVGVRGLHGNYSDRLVTLIDGRAADNPVWGGSNSLWLPVLLEDIDRIEIVRGPAGALWGANALNGVINIITKDPEDDPGWLASTTWNHFGESSSLLRWAEGSGDWSWRVTLGFEDRLSSDETLDDADVMNQAVFVKLDEVPINDRIRSYRFDTKVIHRPSAASKWSLGVGHNHAEFGAIVPLDGPEETGSLELTRLFVRTDQEVDEETAFHFQWFLNRLDYDDSDLLNYVSIENDLEAQVDFVPAEQHAATVGASLRYVHVFTDNDEDTPGRWNFVEAPFDEFWAGLFALDRIDVSRRVALEAQMRGDWYSENGVDWSGRLTGLFAADENRRHILRLGAARAYRASLPGLRSSASLVALPSPPFPADLYGITFLAPDGDLDNEHTWSIEAGYRGRLSDLLSVSADVFYQRYEDLIGLVKQDDPDGFGREIVQAQNQDGADSYGIEVEAALRDRDWSVSGWYTVHFFEPDDEDQTVRAFEPSEHKAGITGLWRISPSWTVSLLYRYASKLSSDHRQISVFDVDADHRLDLTVTTDLGLEGFEIAVGAHDVLDETSPPVQTARFISHETPGRTFFVRLQLRF